MKQTQKDCSYCQNLVVALMAGLVFLVLFYAPVKNYKVSDPKGILLVSQALIEYGTPNLGLYPKEVLEKYKFTYHTYVDGDKTYYIYPLGSSFFSLPFVWVSLLRGWDMTIPQHDVKLQFNHIGMYSTGANRGIPWSGILLKLHYA